MVDSVRVEVEGLRLVARNLRAVDKDLPKGLTQIHKKVAEPIAEKARPRVRSRTGRLARSIRAGGGQRAATVTAGARLPYPYGPINHYGGYPGNYAGNPFLTDTFRREAPESITLYDKLLGEWFDSVWTDS